MRQLLAVLIVTLVTGCALRQPPDLERAIAEEGLVVAQKVRQLADAVTTTALSNSDKLLVRSRITGVNTIGRDDLSNALTGMDTATSPEARFRYQKNALDAVARMRGQLREAMKLVSNDAHLAVLADEIDALLEHMALTLGGA